VHNYDASTPEGQICGRCKIANGSYIYGAKERKVFAYLQTQGLSDYLWTVRDQAMGCGSRRRPDGAMQLPQALCARLEGVSGWVLFVLEVDEHYHKYNTLACEIKRIHEISDAAGCAVYVLRYNPDAPGALEDDALAALHERIVSILEVEHVEALGAPDLVHVEYIGYPEARMGHLAEQTAELQAGAMAVMAIGGEESDWPSDSEESDGSDAEMAEEPTTDEPTAAQQFAAWVVAQRPLVLPLC